MTVPELPGAWVWLARILRPQGRKGEVFADILTDFPDKFAERKQVFLLSPTELPEGASAEGGALSARKAELDGHWLHKGGVVLHFAGVDSISDAETLKGMAVAIPRAERVPLAENEAYVSDLIGCTVVDVAGAAPVTVGEIEDVDRSAGQAPLLVVRGAADEVLIPFAKSYLKKIDLEARRVEMALPVGLIDLNQVLSTRTR
jgi:16S rRNA processing protein RimM